MSGTRNINVEYFNLNWKDSARFAVKDEKWAEGQLTEEELDKLKQILGKTDATQLVIDIPAASVWNKVYKVSISLQMLSEHINSDRDKVKNWLEEKAEHSKFHHDVGYGAAIVETKDDYLKLKDNEENLPVLYVYRSKNYSRISSALGRADVWRDRLMDLDDHLQKWGFVYSENADANYYAFRLSALNNLYKLARHIEHNNPQYHQAKVG